MVAWAAVVAFLVALISYLAGDLATLLQGAAELAAVATLFALVCATEAWN